jgi:SAM-dependent methyltransferase
MSYTEKTACRSCTGKLEELISLGDIAVVNFGNKAPLMAPLTWAKCKACSLVQLKHTVDPEYLFRWYYYKSGVNQTMREHLTGLVRDVEERVELKTDDVVVDIGANDGTLLAAYSDRVTKVGFEPAQNLSKELKRVADYTVVDFFNKEGYFTFLQKPAKVITSISMFYDLDDPNAFLKDVKEVLAKKGVLVIQQNYLPAMLENNAVDNMVHEHLEYYTMLSLSRLMERNGLKIFDVQFNELNGGSCRTYITHIENAPNQSPEVIRAMNRELQMGLDTLKPYVAFSARVKDNARKLRLFVKEQAVDRMKRVYVYGASTRGNTLLQVTGLDWKQVSFAVERNPAKWGTKTVGTDIPIISEEEARKRRPEFMLVLPWHFMGEFVEREMAYLLSGGTFIVPLPEPYLLRVTRLP